MFYQNTSASRSAETAESCMEKMENKPDDSTNSHQKTFEGEKMASFVDV